MDKKAALARLHEARKNLENLRKYLEKEITYEEFEKKAEMFQERSNKCYLLDEELESGQIFKDEFNKQIIKILDK